MFEYLADYPERSSRFANMMRGFTEGKAYDLKYITDFYPWEQHSGGTVVDVSSCTKPWTFARAIWLPI